MLIERKMRFASSDMEEESMTPPLFRIVNGVQDDLESVSRFLHPMMDQQFLLQRTSMELQLLLKHSFLAIADRSDVKEALDDIDGPCVGSRDGILVGFCALEIYSKKLAELQCLAVRSCFRRNGVGKALVRECVERAKAEKVLELMAISNSEDMFRACGFDYSLPNQKRAFFLQP